MAKSVSPAARKRRATARRRKPPPSKSTNGRTGSRELILDAAEGLFAERGFDGVSLRDIAREAGVKLSLIDYYLGNKQDAFQAVIGRRAGVLNRLRLAKLEDIHRRADGTIEDVLEAFVSPYLEVTLGHEPGWRNYIRLLAQLAQTNRWLSLIEKQFNPTTLKFVDELCRIEPAVPRKIMARCMEFTINILLGAFTESGRIEGLSGNAIRADQLEQAYAHMILFLAAGARSLIAGPQQAVRPRPLSRVAIAAGGPGSD